MKNHSPLHTRFDPTWDLTKRLELVMSLQRRLGHVNRKILMEAYGLTQLQASSLMRDFIQAHAKHLEWNATHGYYSMKT